MGRDLTLIKRISTPLAACGLLGLAGIIGSVPPAAAQATAATSPAPAATSQAPAVPSPAAPAAPPAAAASPSGTQLLAQSAQLTVLANVDSQWLTLRIQRTSNQTPLVVKDVAVSVAGHAIPVKARPDGSFVLPVKQLGTTYTPTLDIIVGHDGIREILTGKLTLPQSGGPVPAGRTHNQMFWWVLNIAIVFGVAMFFTNRKKKPDEAAE